VSVCSWEGGAIYLDAGEEEGEIGEGRGGSAAW